ncbi:hypothetical protein BAZOLSSOX_2710, partial [uncultured Gammaproteobacteria bacterium]
TSLIYKGLCGFVVYQTREREGSITIELDEISLDAVYQTREREGSITKGMKR